MVLYTYTKCIYTLIQSVLYYNKLIFNIQVLQVLYLKHHVNKLSFINYHGQET